MAFASIDSYMMTLHKRWLVFYKCCIYEIIGLFLNFTPVLWAPQNWLYWLQTVIMYQGGYVDVEPLVGNSTQCKTYHEKKEAISGPTTNVSGYYGPGAYLAWLLTAYVASMSSIWHSKLSATYNEENFMDGEVLAAIAYPLIAVCDVLYRLFRCRLDPGMNAALFVISSATLMFSSAARLSWQDNDGGITDDIFPAKTRGWIWISVSILGHSLIIGTIGEPYNNLTMTITMWPILAFIILYSGFTVEVIRDHYPYHNDMFRPPLERTVVFSLCYIVYVSILAGKGHSIIPATNVKMTDMDQLGPFLGTIFTLLFFRRASISEFISYIRQRRAGFFTLPEHDNEQALNTL